MSFNIAHFANLRTNFNTWSSLRDYLTSKDGGSLRVIEIPHSDYAVVRYVKGTSDMSKEHVRVFRSVVWNTQTNRPVSVSPVKAERGDPPQSANVVISDFVDGVMINVFRDSAGVHLATRTSFGATNTFYTQKTFADMLNDACNGSWQTEFSYLNPGEYLNLVLIHPDHRNVGVWKTARYFVTSSGTVSEDGSVTVIPSTQKVKHAPHIYPNRSVRELMEEGQKRGYIWQGLVFQDRTSMKRWRIRNPDYVKVRTLRGAESDSFARFLRLRANGTMKEYLGYYRNESNEMWAFEQLWRSLTNDLYNSYVDMNITKKKTMKELPLPLRTHVYALHGKYLASLPKEGSTEKPVPVTKEMIIKYMNALPLEDQMKIVNGQHLKAEWRKANKLE
jgi:hypothetical protein